MDPKSTNNTNNNNNNNSPYDDGNSPPAKRTRLSLPTSFEVGSAAGAERAFVELISKIMKPLLKDLVQLEVKKALQAHLSPHLLESLRERKETGEEVKEDDGKEMYKLVFWNEPVSIIFTNNEIKAKNGELLKVAICDATTNAIICTGHLSSAQVEVFLLDGDYGGSGQLHHPLSPRDGKRPLLVGSDLTLILENGVAYIHSLSITDNSSWIKSKKFRLAVKIKDDKMFSPPIRVAVSQPFRVMDHRGEVNKKHHPPSGDDEIWRLEGIGKDGAYHKNLSSCGIKTVGDFLKAYNEIGHASLKKLLGNKVPKKTWEMMVDNAMECVKLPSYQQISKANDWANKVIGDQPPFNQVPDLSDQQKNNLGYGSSQIPGVMNFNVGDPFGYNRLGYGDFPLLLTGDAFTPNTLKELGQS